MVDIPEAIWKAFIMFKMCFGDLIGGGSLQKKLKVLNGKFDSSVPVLVF